MFLLKTEQSYRKDQDDRRRDNAVPKSNEYQAPRGGGEGREYRGAPRGNDRDNRYSREGDYRANRGNNRDDSRRENGDSRAPAYRPPNSSSRPNQQRTTDDRWKTRYFVVVLRFVSGFKFSLLGLNVWKHKNWMSTPLGVFEHG